jgi:hypothetical protein
MTQHKTTMNRPGSSKPKPAQVARPKYEHTNQITISGVGQSLEDERFLRVAVGDKTTLLNVDNVADVRFSRAGPLTRDGICSRRGDRGQHLV